MQRKRRQLVKTIRERKQKLNITILLNFLKLEWSHWLEFRN